MRALQMRENIFSRSTELLTYLLFLVCSTLTSSGLQAMNSSQRRWLIADLERGNRLRSVLRIADYLLYRN